MNPNFTPGSHAGAVAAKSKDIQEPTPQASELDARKPRQASVPNPRPVRPPAQSELDENRADWEGMAQKPSESDDAAPDTPQVPRRKDAPGKKP